MINFKFCKTHPHKTRKPTGLGFMIKPGFYANPVMSNVKDIVMSQNSLLANYPHAFLKKRRGYCYRLCPSVRPLCYLYLNHWTKFNQIWCVSYSHEWDAQHNYPHAFLKKRRVYCYLLRPSVCPSVMLSPPKPLDEIQPNFVIELLT